MGKGGDFRPCPGGKDQMHRKIETIGFDADDTLWQNETFFHLTHDRFAELLADYTERDHLLERLLEAERRNLGHYGFGIKGFMLSMIETAIEVTEQKVPLIVTRTASVDSGRRLRNFDIFDVALNHTALAQNAA